MTAVLRAPEPSLRHRAPVVIQATRGWTAPKLRDAWEHRELLYFFALRDLKVKYAQTALGAAWTVVQPIALMLIFTIAFRRIGRVSTGEIPYPLFVFAGLTFWIFFSRTVSQGSDSLVANAPLLTKTATPRLLMPAVPVLSSLFDFVVMFVLLLGIAAVYGVAPTWRLALVPPVIGLGVLLALGVSLLFSAVNVRYRDVRNALPFMIQSLLFLSPIAYPLERLGDRWESVLALNPLVGLIEAFRWAVIASTPPTALELGVSVGASMLVFSFGLAYFARVERVFADVA